MALCECGCGEPAPIAKRTYGNRGVRKGEPMRYIRGHSTRVITPESHANRSAAASRRMQRPGAREAVSATHGGKTIGAEHRARLSEANARERNNNWKGGRTPHGAGYVYVNVGVGHPMANPKGYALEHRIVVAGHIGRVLDRVEVVHHINGVKDDNRIENLQLLPDHSAHGRLHAALRACA